MIKKQTERSLSFSVTEFLSVILDDSVMWTHFPAGEARKKKTAGLLKRMGTKAGWADYILLHGGKTYFIELKRPKAAGVRAGILSDEQRDFLEWVVVNGYCAAVCYSVDDVALRLKEWGLPMKGKFFV